MYEINQQAFLRHARQDHSRLLKLSEEARLIESARPYTPKLWDDVALNLGDWLIRIGNDLKTRSVYTKLSEKRV